jgi:hypothetical protein
VKTVTRPTPALTVALLLLSACDSALDGSGSFAAEPSQAPTAAVDSILPVEEEIRRFLATLPEEVTGLAGGEESRDALVARFVRSLEAGDTLDLARMAMGRGEFGYLYYPTSRYTRPPYRLSPELVWFQNRNQSDRGLSRLLSRYGGQAMGYVSYQCPGEPEAEGENRFWHLCSVSRVQQGDTVSVRLFGSIWERDGHFKLVGFANEL